MFENTLIQLAAAHAWQGLLLLPFGWVLLKTIGKGQASTRCTVWTGIMAALLVLPFLSLVELPRLVDGWAMGETVSEASGATAKAAAQLTAPVGEAAADALVVGDAGLTMAAQISLGLLALWFAGFALQIFRLGRDYAASRRLWAATDLVEVSAKYLPVRWRRRVSLMASARVSSPMVLGAFKPKIILPNAIFETLTGTQIRLILMHELAHVERRDPALAIAQRLIAAILWWSPWVYLVSSRIDEERELACDDRAVAFGGNPADYARTLVEGFALSKAAPAQALAVGAFDRPSALKHRVLRLAGRNYAARQKASRKASATITGLLIAGMLSVAIATPGVAWEGGPGNTTRGDVFASPLQRVFVEEAGVMSVRELRQMIDAGADVNGAVSGDGSALIAAAKSGRMENVRFLVEQGAEVNMGVRGDGNPLIAAADNGNLRILEFLIENGADVDAIVPGDETALINAVRSGQLDAVKLLVEAGADVSLGVMAPTIRGEEWRSPLGEALKRNRRAIVEYLREQGALAE